MDCHPRLRRSQVVNRLVRQSQQDESLGLTTLRDRNCPMLVELQVLQETRRDFAVQMMQEQVENQARCASAI